MKIRTAHTTRKRGFTLVELLVVIAIIGILAGIVVPNVTRYIRKGRVARAVSEIRGAELALTGMLTDVGRSKFIDFLNPAGKKLVRNIFAGNRMNVDALLVADEFYTTMFYELLRKGKDADLSFLGGDIDLDRDVRGKLGNSYQDLGLDPWGNRYHFSMGPHRGAILLRSYRVATGIDTVAGRAFYAWDENQRGEEQRRLPGQPGVDRHPDTGAFLNLAGFPAPKDLPVYIFSLGANSTIDALWAAHEKYGTDDDFRGGGDDPNNWDNQAGWNSAPE